MRLSLIAICAATLLTACGTSYYEGDENSPYYVAPVGTHILLAQELTFASDEVGIYIQNGNIVRFPQVNTFSPYCKFELYNKSEAPQKIAPDEFAIVKAVQLIPNEVFLGNPFRRVATDMGVGGLKQTYYTTRMFLKSTKQPNVYLMDCENRGGIGGEARITIAEMRKTLAPIFSLQIPPRQPK